MIITKDNVGKICSGFKPGTGGMISIDGTEVYRTEDKDKLETMFTKLVQFVSKKIQYMPFKIPDNFFNDITKNPLGLPDPDEMIKNILTIGLFIPKPPVSQNGIIVQKYPLFGNESPVTSLLSFSGIPP